MPGKSSLCCTEHKFRCRSRQGHLKSVDLVTGDKLLISCENKQVAYLVHATIDLALLAVENRWIRNRNIEHKRNQTSCTSNIEAAGSACVRQA
jgi:hypothetical protein